MKGLDHFSIPIFGLKNGVHTFKYEMDDKVFSNFDYGILKKGNFDVEVTLEKIDESMEFSFIAKGYIEVDCDRCTANIKMPLLTEESYIIEFGETPSNIDNIITVLISDHYLNIAPYIYESLSLSIPMVKLIDCEDEEKKPCDENILNYLNKETESEPTNSIWNSLKDIKFKK